MLASYIAKTVKDEASPKSTPQRMVSLLSRKPLEEKQKTEDNQNGGTNDQIFWNDTKSIISLEDTIQLSYCTDESCGCKAVHCPFCEPSQHKPAAPAKIRDHLEMKHFNHGIQFEGLLVMKCIRKCRSESHYHCPICDDTTFLKRIPIFKHLIAHAQKMGKDTSVIQLPDIKLPSSIIAEGKEIKLCKKSCDNVGEPHYHCPQCDGLHTDRKSVICHVWRCEDGQGKESSTATSYPVDPEHLKKAYQTISDVPPITEQTTLKPHISIVRGLSDLCHNKCQLPNCCNKRIHCSLCLKDRYAPAYPMKIRTHYYTHWARRIPCNGYFVLPCYLDCQLKAKDDSVVSTVQCHYHCPKCGFTRRRREHFIHHIEICGREGKANSKPREIWSKEELLLEEFDPAFDENIDNCMFDESRNTTNNSEEADLDTFTDNLNLQRNLTDIQVYSQVTAEISRQLLSLANSKGVTNKLFHDVAEKTNTKYLVSPGTISSMHSLQGDLQSVTKAMELIEQEFGIRCQRRSTVNVQPEQEEPDIPESVEQVNDTPPEKGRKRVAVSDPQEKVTKKRIKKEPGEPETPVRKYSTRGKVVDFSALSGGRTKPVEEKETSTLVTKKKESDKIEAATLATKKKELDKKETSSPASTKKNSGQGVEEEIMIVNEKNQKFKLMLPHDMVEKIKQKMGADDAVRLDDIGNFEELDENGDESETDVSFTDENWYKNSKGRLITSNCIDYFVRRYKLRNYAVIPKVKLANKQTTITKAPKKSIRVVNKYRCSQCDFACDKFTECNKHLQEAHMTESKYSCDICERHFDKECYLKIHLDTKHGPFLEKTEYKCEYCDHKPFQSFYALGNHIESKHSKTPRKKNACRKCDFVGEDRADLESHVKENHFIDSSLCPECGREYRTPILLAQHIQNVHGEKNIECPMCEKKFCSERSVKLHMDVHLGQSKFSCSVCGQKFKKKGNLTAHEQIHLNKEDRTYRYKCTHCGLKVNSKAHLIQHMNIHTGDRPYPCDICGKTFSFISAVQKHKVFCHSTENPFECTICDKRFKMKRLLNDHMITHTGASIHECQYCKRIFTTASSLKTHLTKCKVLHPIQPVPNKIIVFTNPPRVNTSESALTNISQDTGKESVIRLQMGHMPTMAQNETVIVDSGAGYYIQQVPQTQQDLAIDSIATKIEPTTQEEQLVEMTAEVGESSIDGAVPADVQVYLCSECNMAFNDYAMAEQHVLQGHDSNITVTQTSDQSIVSSDDTVNILYTGVDVNDQEGI